MAGFLICLFVSAVLAVTLGWAGVVGGGVGLVLGILLSTREDRAQRLR